MLDKQAGPLRIIHCLLAVDDYRYYPGNDLTNHVTDMLTDLRHFCDLNDVPFHGCLDSSYILYLKERQRAEPTKPEPIKVVINVRGGVAYCDNTPAGVEVEIIDHDNERS